MILFQSKSYDYIMRMTTTAPPVFAEQDASLCLAHLSDPHLTSFDTPPWKALFNKRALGYWAWHRKRRHVHRADVLATLLDHLRQAAPDHIAVTGDLTHLGTPDECRQALAWLQALGTPHDVSVVPGNHDAYAPASWADTIGLWRDYMLDETRGHDEIRGKTRNATLTHAALNEPCFPFVRHRGPVALIGVSTAIPTPWPLATGALGTGQLERLEHCLRRAGDEGRFRILLIHHPSQHNAVGWRKRLADAPALRGVLARAGVELILQGHAHRRMDAHLPTPHGEAVVFGAPSASLLPNGDAIRAPGYTLLRVTCRAEHWTLTATHRHLSDLKEGVVTTSADVTYRGSTKQRMATLGNL